MIIGIDPSLSSTVVCVMKKLPSNSSLFFVSSPPLQAPGVTQRVLRLHGQAARVQRIVAESSPALIVLEGYGGILRQQGATEMIEYGAYLRHALCEVCARIFECPPATLKKFATPTPAKKMGAKSADAKIGVATEIAKRFGKSFATSDEYDAFACAWLGWCIQSDERAANKRQLEAVQTVIDLNTKPKKRGKR